LTIGIFFDKIQFKKPLMVFSLETWGSRLSFVRKEVQLQVEKRTGLYETTFVVNTALGEEAVNALKEKFTSLIAENATVEKTEEWGNRKLAYPIDDYTEGFYVYVKYTAPTAFPAELKRILNITDGILRSLTIKCEE
jgi:small subunit ribosomal protein S6